MSELIIKFGEPTWAFDWEYAFKTNTDRYLIKLIFWINGEKGYSIGHMSENPGEYPELYNQFVQKMKDDLPEIYERGEIQEAPQIVAD